LSLITETYLKGLDAHSVPSRLKQIALSISTLLDVRSLTVSNLAGRLRAAEEAFEEPPAMLQ
jgi:hypothetical protein